MNTTYLHCIFAASKAWGGVPFGPFLGLAFGQSEIEQYTPPERILYGELPAAAQLSRLGDALISALLGLESGI